MSRPTRKVCVGAVISTFEKVGVIYVKALEKYNKAGEKLDHLTDSFLIYKSWILFELKGYGYRVIVTNLSMKPKNIWKFHCQRAKGAELNIRELKNSYHLINVPTKGYTANIAYCQILMFGYNIISWFKRLYLPKEFRYATLQTIREKILVLPGRLIETNHKNVLKLPADYIHQELFKNILSKIEKLKF